VMGVGIVRSRLCSLFLFILTYIHVYYRRTEVRLTSGREGFRPTLACSHAHWVRFRSYRVQKADFLAWVLRKVSK
jgi:hypothetical protein